MTWVTKRLPCGSFRASADSHNANLSASPKLALASLYRSQHQDKQAIETLQSADCQTSETAGKTTAQIGLAETYEADGQPLEAKRIYQQIQKENPSSAAAQLAQEKLQALK